jgi:glycosyltransferase involved in cell wall biosynthesis
MPTVIDEIRPRGSGLFEGAVLVPSTSIHFRLQKALEMAQIDIVIPVYNESVQRVEQTAVAVQRALQDQHEVRVIIVDDGSDPRFELEKLKGRDDITFVQHDVNMGYGAALKTGILSGDAPHIGIIDADATYPPESLPDLVQHIESYDMVTGIRTSEIQEIPLVRRFPKWLLNSFASYMAGRKIRDLNSGMRIFSRDLCYYLWSLYPSGFSFTSTITMGALLDGFRIKEIPINYYRREGSSSMRPVRDTIRFFRTVCRLGLVFAPMRLFGPVALLLFIVAAVKGLLIDYRTLGIVGNMSVFVMLVAVQITMLGLLGKLVVLSRRVGSFHNRFPTSASRFENAPILKVANRGKSQNISHLGR